MRWNDAGLVDWGGGIVCVVRIRLLRNLGKVARGILPIEINGRTIVQHA